MKYGTYYIGLEFGPHKYYLFGKTGDVVSMVTDTHQCHKFTSLNSVIAMRESILKKTKMINKDGKDYYLSTIRVINAADPLCTKYDRNICYAMNHPAVNHLTA